MEELILQVPDELSYPFFFPKGELTWEKQYANTFQHNQLFVHEAGFYAGLSVLKPWENPEKYIPQLLSECEKIKNELEELFKRRDLSHVLKPMKQLIGLYLEFLFWSNETPVSFPLETITNFKLKPVNIQDRIGFILARPTLYHSFIQLLELMNEQEKLFSKSLLLKNIKQTKNVRE